MPAAKAFITTYVFYCHDFLLFNINDKTIPPPNEDFLVAGILVKRRNE
jgi:hypothetical protein